MPGSGEAAILPRCDLTLHHVPPATLPRTHTITCPPLKEERQEWVNSLSRSRALNDGSCWTEDTTPTMPARKHPTLRSRDTWHGWSPSSRFNSIRLPGSTSRSTRSRDIRFGSTRSYDPRHYSIRSRASLNPSIRSRSSVRSLASRASSTLHRSFRRTGPIYRVATSRARAAREWAGTFREQISSKGGTLLLTPARGRRQPEVVATRGSPTPDPARNSPWVHATRRATSASRTVHWEVASGLAALFECGATAGSAAAAGVGRVCSAAAAMADGKLQQLRRSISSWSLSTVKKPKITVPKLKTPKIKVFRGKKNR